MIETFVADLIAAKKKFFHFTDERNLDSIRTHGLLSLRELRRSGIAIAAPGGNYLSWKLDEDLGMDAFVHLCLRRNHPMARAATQDGRITTLRYLKICPKVALLPGVEATLDVANKTGVRRYPVSEAVQNADFDKEVLYTQTDWNDPQIQDRLQRAERYELLVPNHIPIEYIVGL